jgi:2,4-diketo-3-deoxy-L-fuconate hydrolase
VELGVVIGTVARNVPREGALEFVAGYLVINDLSERAFQLEHGGQWVKGKSCDTFGPLGPMLVTTDEISDPQTLAMWLEVNGHRYQNGTSADMIFGVAYLVSYISRYMTLMPGDVISTGTPAGVGLGQKPPKYLKAGDIVELGIEGLGRQRQRLVEAPG